MSTPSDVPTMTELVQRSAAAGRSDFGGDAHLVCDNVVRIYRTTGVEVVALQGLDLVVDRGELVAIVGPSGSGKSTLLSILSGLDVPTAGGVRVAGHDLAAMGRRERLRYRRQVVGFIWQQTARNLLGYLTARENLELAQGISGASRRDSRTRSAELLELLGVADCADRIPGQLSGGEQQRVAIAVGLANRPEVLFADEPTGELDTATAAEVFAALRHVNAELGVTVLVVTHDAGVSEQVKRTVSIRDGRTSTETLRRAGSSGEHLEQEYAVLDRVGRLQLPTRFTRSLQLRHRVRLELEPDHIGVWPGEDHAAGEEQK
ncbi:MAG TPA: ABC transporter ATP-binding protein [Candidatus Nanopelagicales bacterium]|nr:ABC transporter ATP-binding protein [Candidatus Nanopelagicales bacterium]